MNQLHENIFFRLLPALLAGIIAGHIFPELPVAFILVTTLSLIALMPTFRLLSVVDMYRYQFVYGIILILIVMMSGTLIMITNIREAKSYLENEQADFIQIRITEEPAARERIYKVTGEIIGFVQHNSLRKVSGKCLLFIQKTDKSKSLRYNDVLLCKNTLQLVQRDPNPHSINYKQILNNKGIYESGFLKDSEYIISRHIPGIDLGETAIQTRKYCLRIINKYLPHSDAAAVCASLLLGQRDQLSFDLENAYASAGVIHILAVSGMHVGLIYLLIQFILTKAGIANRFKTLNFLIMIACIWFFALVTGLTASVVRASTMISFVAAGRSLQRPLFTLNILFASAFVLLVINPFLFFDIGFQLSFSAVSGIIILQPKLYEWFQTPNPILDNILNVMSVSIAAQAFTLPLIMFYFHQVPIHFILANLIVVPILSLVIYALVGLVAFSQINIVASITGLIISWVVYGINNCIEFIQSLPFALLQIRSYNSIMLMISLSIVVLFTWFLYNKNIQYLRLTLASFIVLLLFSTILDYLKVNQQNIQVFAHERGDIVAIRNNHQAAVIYPAQLNLRSGAFDRYLKQYFMHENVNEVLCIPQQKNHHLELTADWFVYKDGCLSGKAFKYYSEGKKNTLQVFEKSFILNELPFKNSNVYTKSYLASKPFLIPLNGNELSVY